MPHDHKHYDDDYPRDCGHELKPAPWPGEKKTLRFRLTLWWAGVKDWWNFKLPNDIIQWGQGK